MQMESHRIRPMPPGISLISFIGAETSGIYFRYQKIDIVIQKPFAGKKEDRRYQIQVEIYEQT
jgi:hypothetical protein